MPKMDLAPFDIDVMVYSLDRDPPHLHAIIKKWVYVLDINDDDPLMAFAGDPLEDEEKAGDPFPDVEPISEDMIRVTFNDGSVREYKIDSSTTLDPIEILVDAKTGEEIADPMGPIAKHVEALPEMMLKVTFENGEVRLYNAKPLFDEKDEDLFRHAHLSPGGYGIIWDGDTDLAIEEIWENGV